MLLYKIFIRIFFCNYLISAPWDYIYSNESFYFDNQLRLNGITAVGNNVPCGKCGKLYSTRSIMLRHMNHECGVEKKIVCYICHKRFRRKWNLEQHIKRIHC